MYRQLRKYLAAALCLSCSAVYSAAPAGVSLLSQAKSEYQNQHYATALSLLDRYLQTDPDNLDARFLQGLVLSKQNKITEAVNVFELLTRKYPKKPEPYNNLAVLYASQGKFDKARDVLLQAIRTHHSYATAYENLGSIYAKMAINAYTSALDLKKQQVASDIKLAMLDDITPTSAPPLAGQQVEKPLATVATATVTPQPKPTAPAPTKVTTNAHQLQVEQQILNTLLSWSKAWSNKNTENYLAYYADEFKPPHGMSRKAWEQQRRSRIRGPSFIKVTINSPEIKMLNNSSAELKFSQKYRSDSFRDQVKKVILMKKIDGKWQIVRENAAG